MVLKHNAKTSVSHCKRCTLLNTNTAGLSGKKSISQAIKTSDAPPTGRTQMHLRNVTWLKKKNNPKNQVLLTRTMLEKQGCNTQQHVNNTIFNWNVNLLFGGHEAWICKAFFFKKNFASRPTAVLRFWSYWTQQHMFLKVLPEEQQRFQPRSKSHSELTRHFKRLSGEARSSQRGRIHPTPPQSKQERRNQPSDHGVDTSHWLMQLRMGGIQHRGRGLPASKHPAANSLLVIAGWS